jgi:hypothetical protein
MPGEHQQFDSRRDLRGSPRQILAREGKKHQRSGLAERAICERARGRRGRVYRIDFVRLAFVAA